MSQEWGRIIELEVRAEDVANLAGTRHDDRLRKLVIRSGLPGVAELFSDNPQDVAAAKLRLVRSFASAKRGLVSGASSTLH